MKKRLVTTLFALAVMTQAFAGGADISIKPRLEGAYNSILSNFENDNAKKSYIEIHFRKKKDSPRDCIKTAKERDYGKKTVEENLPCDKQCGVISFKAFHYIAVESPAQSGAYRQHITGR